MNPPDLISIVIPTFNRWEMLFRCLERLKDNCLEATQIIVCDDAGDEALETALLKHFKDVLYQSGPGLGPASNRNFGAMQAKGEWLLFLDDDILPNQNLISEYRAAISKHPDAHIFEGKTSAECPRRSRAEHAPINELGGYLWSCNLLVRRDVFIKLGMFNPTFTEAAMEDVELAYRIKTAELQTVFVPSANVIHPWRVVSRLNWFSGHFKATLRHLELHPEERNRIGAKFHLNLLVRRSLFETPRTIIQRDWQGLRFMLLDHCYTLTMIVALLAKHLFTKP